MRIEETIGRKAGTVLDARCFVNFERSVDSGRLRSYGVYFGINFTIYFVRVPEFSKEAL